MQIFLLSSFFFCCPFWWFYSLYHLSSLLLFSLLHLGPFLFLPVIVFYVSIKTTLRVTDLHFYGCPLCLPLSPPTMDGWLKYPVLVSDGGLDECIWSPAWLLDDVNSHYSYVYVCVVAVFVGEEDQVDYCP